MPEIVPLAPDYAAWPDAAIVQEAPAQLPLYHQPARLRGHRAGSGGRSGVRAVWGAWVGLAFGDGGAFL